MNRFQLAGIAGASLMGLTACAAAPAAAPAASAEDIAAGSQLWEHRCRGCHEPGLPGIPVKAQLARMKPAAVEAALTRGKMRDIAEGLTEQEIRQVAAFATQPQ